MDIIEADKVCICKSCPSFVDCGEPISFCMPERGKVACIDSENGCVCPACPVQDKMNFSHEYYCMRGNEKEQSA